MMTIIKLKSDVDGNLIPKGTLLLNIGCNKEDHIVFFRNEEQMIVRIYYKDITQNYDKIL